MCELLADTRHYKVNKINYSKLFVERTISFFMEKFHKVCKRMVVWKTDLLLWWRLLYFVAFFAKTFVFKFDWKHWEMLLKIP